MCQNLICREAAAAAPGTRCSLSSAAISHPPSRALHMRPRLSRREKKKTKRKKRKCTVTQRHDPREDTHNETPTHARAHHKCPFFSCQPAAGKCSRFFRCHLAHHHVLEISRSRFLGGGFLSFSSVGWFNSSTNACQSS